MVVVPLLGEREVDEHCLNLDVVVVGKSLDADVVEISHTQPLWLLRALRPRCPRRRRRRSRCSRNRRR